MSLTVLAAAVIVQHVVACVSLGCSREKFGLHTSIGKVAASAIVQHVVDGGGLFLVRSRSTTIHSTLRHGQNPLLGLLTFWGFLVNSETRHTRGANNQISPFLATQIHIHEASDAPLRTTFT